MCWMIVCVIYMIQAWQQGNSVMNVAAGLFAVAAAISLRKG